MMNLAADVAAIRRDLNTVFDTVNNIEALVVSFDNRVREAEAKLPAAAQDIATKMNSTTLGRAALKALGINS